MGKRRVIRRITWLWCGLVLTVALLVGGCSVRKMAIRQVGKSLASGSGVFASDSDPKLVKEALPFGLKLMEALLEETPQNRELLLATCRGFTQYAYAFIQQEADRAEGTDLQRAESMRERARRLYLRARDYGFRGLELKHEGFSEELREAPDRALAKTSRRDVPLLYWTAAAWGSAVSVSLDRPDLIADLPDVEALMNRALELDPDFRQGAIHSFFINFEMAQPADQEKAARRARAHFRKAVTLSNGQKAGPYVSLAESVALPLQNREEFTNLLNKALEIDSDARPEWRLNNLIMQQRARWLLERRDELFWKR